MNDVYARSIFSSVRTPPVDTHVHRVQAHGIDQFVIFIVNKETNRKFMC